MYQLLLLGEAVKWEAAGWVWKVEPSISGRLNPFEKTLRKDQERMMRPSKASTPRGKTRSGLISISAI